MDSQKSVKALRKDLYRGTFSLLVLALVAAFAIFSHLTIAWYANNKDVKANNTTITSATQGSNLFIRPQSDATSGAPKDWASYVEYLIGVLNPSDPGLYPISTIDCTNWYAIKDWTLNYGAAVDGVIKAKYEPSTFATVSANTDGLYTSSGKSYRAYYKTEYNIYTDKESLNIFFNPEDPISIVYTPSAIADVDRRLNEAIRVAMIFGENDPIIFSPAADSSNFKAVTGSTTVADASAVVKLLSGLNDYKASAKDGSDFEYTAGNTSLGTATPDGIKLTVYVWLEGTDDQAIVNVSDGETGANGGLSVRLSIVGVEP